LKISNKVTFAITLFKNHDFLCFFLNLKPSEVQIRTNLQHFTFSENDDRNLMIVFLGHEDVPIVNLLKKLKKNDKPAVKATKIN
jgi:hypothetical protein